ncbi:hypothetical protein [Nocardia caishijiensis]|uniref:Uncharacterized protein n=1 Tax=Nocardia caishijiensis TaxID=184756 RepID=A0ABQ6YHQ0_9NOCA|nr:hypothetical protein [Nocardia caishijiensis]KAF0845295.1 hypothetical protein FNL39_108103 [Nocardia caishijiensis]
MSGRKQIYVDESEWNRLQAQARELGRVNRDLPGLLDRVREQTEHTARRAVAEMTQRQAGFEAAVATLSAEMRDSEMRSDQRLRTTSNDIMNRLREQDTQLRAESAQALRAHRTAFERALAEENAERRAQFDAIDAALTGVREDNARAAALTTSSLADADVLRTQVLAYPHERFCPGRLASLDADRADLVAAIDSGAPPGYLLGSARALVRQMSELRSQLAVLDAQWRACRYAAERGLVQLQQVVEGNATIDTAATFGVESPLAPDVDHWSEGRLAQLDDEVAELLAKVRDDAAPLSIEELDAVVETVIPELDQRLDATVEAAVVAVRASQMRANLAELIADTLDNDHQYQVMSEADAGYVDADQRRAFLARTINVTTGNEVVIEIIPNADVTRAPLVEIHSFDGEAAEEERLARIDSIHDSVHERTGIDLRSTTVAAEPDLSRRDVAALVKNPMSRSLD